MEDVARQLSGCTEKDENQAAAKEILTRHKENFFIEDGQTLKQVSQKPHKFFVFRGIKNFTQRGWKPSDLTLKQSLGCTEIREVTLDDFQRPLQPPFLHDSMGFFSFQCPGCTQMLCYGAVYI